MKIGKRICTAVFVAILLIQMTGCGKTAKDGGAETVSGDDFVYVADFQTLDDEYYVSAACFGEDSTIYFAGTPEEGKTKLFQIKLGTAEKTEIAFDTGEMYISALQTDAEGNLVLVLIKANEDTPQDIEEGAPAIAKAEIRKIDPAGKELFREDITNVLNKYSNTYVQGVECDKDGNYYLNAGDKIFLLKPDGSLYSEQATQNNDYISNLFRIRDGRVIASHFTNSGVQKLVDANGMKELNYKLDFMYGCYQGGTDTDLIYTQDNGLYTCNLTDDKPNKILTLSDCDIDSTSPKVIKMFADGTIAIFSVTYNGDFSESELALLSQKKRSEIPEKTILSYGTFYLPYFASKDITDFNKQSDKYRIEVKEYGDDNTDYQTKLNLLNAEITSGKGPDIIDMTYGVDSLENYASAGILEDLNPYFEKDESLSRENFIDNVLKAYEVDGKMYGMMSNFSVQTLVGRVSDVGTGTSWTLDDMIALADSKPKETQILQYATKNSILHLLFMMNKRLFADEETGECNFEGEEFQKILDFANRFPAEADYDPNGPSEMELVRNGGLLLLQQSLTSVSMYQMYEYMFNEPINFIGLPSSEGSGTLIQANGTAVGMNATSANKEGVWEFIHFLLTEERQKMALKGNGGFPVTKKALEEQLEEDMTPEYYEGTDGVQKERPKSTWGGQDYSVEVYAATKEQTERVKDIIKNADSSWQLDDKLYSIIKEEAQAYFEGQKSFEDVASLIQNRVQTYINEKR